MSTVMETPCARCGSPRKISRTWKEKIPTTLGETEVEYSQITCTNKVCQASFDENLLAEEKKREVLKQKKDESERQRKINASKKRTA